jgi:hypothetical protein
VGEQLLDDREHVLAAAAGRDEHLDLVGEADQADAVVVADRREGEGGGEAGDEVALVEVAAAEVEAGRHVDEEHHRQLALLGEQLDVGLAGAGGDVPVDRAHVVAGGVLADLGEGDALALEDGLVRAGEVLVDQARGLDLDATDLAQQLGVRALASSRACSARLSERGAGHARTQGTWTCSRILRTMCSTVSPSASAS